MQYGNLQSRKRKQHATTAQATLLAAEEHPLVFATADMARLMAARMAARVYCAQAPPTRRLQITACVSHATPPRLDVEALLRVAVVYCAFQAPLIP